MNPAVASGLSSIESDDTLLCAMDELIVYFNEVLELIWGSDTLEGRPKHWNPASAHFGSAVFKTQIIE